MVWGLGTFQMRRCFRVLFRGVVVVVVIFERVGELAADVS